MPIPITTQQVAQDQQQLQGACIAYAPGANSLHDDAYLRRLHLIAPLQHPDDPPRLSPTSARY